MRSTRFAATLAIVISAACGPSTPAAQAPGPECREGMAWGGWNGTPECASIAATRINGADLMCRTDADCVLVGVSRCGANSVALRAEQRYRNHRPACGDPRAGGCPDIDFVATCRRGCCNVGLKEAP